VLSREEKDLVREGIAGFAIQSPIARGHHTLVLKAVSTSEARVVAIKTLRPDLADDSRARQWFLDGADRALHLRHETILPALDCGEQGRVCFCVTEFMPGGDAFAHFAAAASGRKPLMREAVECAVRVAEALQYVESEPFDEPLRHGGVRPSKILFDKQGRARLAGLGFDNSWTTWDSDMRDPDVSPYLAPEQRRETGVPCLGADMFGLGASLHYMLTTYAPARALSSGIESPKKLNPAVPDSICRIVERLLDVSPEERYGRYADLLHDLRWVLRGEVMLRE